MMEENEIKAAILSIGRELASIDWYNLSATKAEKWCKNKAQEKGILPKYHEEIAAGAMHYVLAGKTAERG